MHDHESEYRCSCEKHHEGHEHGHGHAHTHARARKSDWLFWGRVALALALALFGQFYLNESRFPWWANLLVMGASYSIIAYDIIAEMAVSIWKEHRFFEESTLMVLASIGAFSLRAFGPENNEYFEGILVILLFQLGEYFQHFAEEKSRKSIASSFDLRHEMVNVKRAGAWMEIPAEELKIGDLVSLRSGGKCPGDGVLVEGRGSFDESSLTGEALPVEKRVGDHLYSGTIFLSGNAMLRIEKEYKDSTVSKLLALVEEGAASKSKATRFLTRFSRVYTPIVMALSLVVAVLPPLLIGPGDGATWMRFIYVALNFLVVSCPCAVVISVPLAYFAGLGLASRKGILVKGATYFDAARQLRLVAFDKTGTLTEGKLSLDRVVSPTLSSEVFLSAFAIAECISTHPIAKAARGYAPIGFDVSEVQEAEEVPGVGTRVLFAGKEYRATKQPLQKENAAPIETIGVIAYLSIDGVDCGYAVFSDAVKPHAEIALSLLRERGIHTLLLSGDKQANVQRALEELPLEEGIAELTPEEKRNHLATETQKKEGTVAFLGDGINDAPSLALADIGVAMGDRGSDLALSSADVLLMKGDPLDFVRFLEIAEKTRRRGIGCISIALIVKIGLMILSTIAAFMGTWSVPLFVSVLGDSGVALVCIFYAVSLFRAKLKTPV